MAVSPDVLVSPRLKVERAYRHIDELIGLTTPLARELYTLRVERNVGRTPRDVCDFGLVYRPAKPIPEALALVIGDALHNLRSALDHLATGVVRSIDPLAQIHFPMRRDRKDLVSPDKGLAGTLRLIEQALPGAMNTLLNEVRPEGAPNDSRWSFHTLDNDDKHNLLIPTVTVVGVSNVHACTGRHHLINCTHGGNAAEPIYMIGSDLPITIQQEFETSVQVSFGPGNVFENESVIPTLTQVAETVAEAINVFERLITSEL